MGEAKRRKLIDPNYGTTPKRKTQRMLKSLRRNELEEFTECLGLLLGKLLTSVRGFCEEAEAEELWGFELNRHYNAMWDLLEEIDSWLEVDE